MEPVADPEPPRRGRYGVVSLFIIVLMIALAAWAWWIPYGYFDRLIALFRMWLHRFR